MEVRKATKREFCATIVLAATMSTMVVYALYFAHGELDKGVPLFLAFSLCALGELVWVLAFHTYPPFCVPLPRPRTRAWRWHVPFLVAHSLRVAGVVIFLLFIIRTLPSIDLGDVGFIVGGTLLFVLIFAPGEWAERKKLYWWVTPLVIAMTLMVIVAITVYFAWFA